MRIDDSSMSWIEGQEDFELWVKPDLNIDLTLVYRR